MALSPTSSRGGAGLPTGVTSPGTGALAFAPTDANQKAIDITMPVGSQANGTDAIRVTDESGTRILEMTADGSYTFKLETLFSAFLVFDGTGGGTLIEGEPGGKLAFFGHTTATQPSVTGALSAVIDPAAKAVLTSLLADLVTLGLASNGTT